MLTPPQDTLLLRRGGRVSRSSNWYDQSQQILGRSHPIGNVNRLPPIVTARTGVGSDFVLVLPKHLGSAYSSGAKCFPVCCWAEANHKLGPLRIPGDRRDVRFGEELLEDCFTLDRFT